ncbi:MAG: metallophosphoesterase family protein [Shimia sp.]|uniref:metallophosphoesterase family protein n=1 Tax=Shimia sp. TaxID=1954381 RepID=UPI004059621C
MTIRDLGELSGEVLLFGGPYSNLQATEAVLAVADARGVAAQNVICTGDVVAYCAEPAQTVACIRASEAVLVAGNCERQLAAGAMDCGCGFEAGTTCDVLSAGWYAHVDREIGITDRAWMADLPDIVVFRHNAKRVAVIHGGVTDIARFLWSTSDEAAFEEEISAIVGKVGAVDMVIAGHSGIAFQRDVAGVQWINAGVIGMPGHSGRQKTEFVVLSDAGAEILALDYDVQTASEKMRSVGLQQGYQKALLSGYWPSEDVLPPDLRLASRASG